jgi:DNA-binding transcriptional MerR regulator
VAQTTEAQTTQVAQTTQAAQLAQGSWTVAELSARVGMSIRNIRAHQSRGLVPAPVRRGRVAYYDDRHERALSQILELQRKGYNLTAVEELMKDDRYRDTARLRTVLAPLLEGEEIALTHNEMAEMFALTPSPQRLADALDTALIRDLGEGRYAVPSRQLLNATLALVDTGMPILDIYGLQVEITRATREVARRFVETCLRCAWPADDDVAVASTAAVQARFEELRDQFTVVLAATFAVNIRRATEELLDLTEPVG